MSKQSEIGKTLLDVRDVCSQRLLVALIDHNNENSLGLSEDQVVQLSQKINAEVHKSFDNCVDAVMRLL
tara:strand:- start:1025 stop:1231 length:207 start_codon:yes stop_codon:yes gene_type:complete